MIIETGVFRHVKPLGGKSFVRSSEVHRRVAAGAGAGAATSKLPWMLLLLLLVLLVAPPAAVQAGNNEALTSTVSVDRRSGRLVRRVVVPERLIPARVVSSSNGSSSGSIPLSLTSGSGIADEPPVHELVQEIAVRQGVDPLLVHAVIHTESAYNRLAVSPKGAEGLMQLIPETARRMGVSNSFNSRQNIEGGVRYLRELQDRYEDLRLVLAAYNAGEGAVDRYRGIPPYAETQDYVYRVGKRYGDLRRRSGSSSSQKRAAAAAVAAAVVTKATEPSSAATAAAPQYRPLESFVDSEGRLHLQTR